MRNFTAVASLFALLCSPSLFAQAERSCEGVLSLAGRDVDLKTRNLATAEEAYNSFCSGSSLKAGLDLKVPLAALVEGLPTDLVGSLSGNVDKTKSLCSNYRSWRAANYSTVDYSSTAVREAIAAWESCKALASKSVFINVNAGVELLQISIRRGQDNALFKGLVVGTTGTSNAVKCSFRQQRTFSLIETDPTGTENMPFPLNTGDDLNVSCKRPSRPDGKGGQFFDSVEITVDTSRGGLRLPWLKDSKYGPTYASEVAAQLTELRRAHDDALVALGKQLAAADAKLNSLGTSTEQKRSAALIPDNDPVSVSCPPGQFAAGVTLQSYKGQSSGVVRNMALLCKRFLDTKP
jgi:hypothetical protein